jgi:hypothetical protein
VNSPRNYLLAFLALTTLGGAVLAWNQHLEVIKLRTALEEKELDAQLQQREFDTKVAALRASAAASAKARAAAAQNSADDQRQRFRNGRFANMQALMNDPQFVKLMALQEKARLDSSYAPLFKQLTQQLNLSPAQLAAFQNLLVQKQDAARDVLAAARDQGLDLRTDRAEIGQLVTQSNTEIDNQIESTLGSDAYAQYQSYEQTLPQRNTVNQIQQSLSYTSSPLTDSQAQQLIQTLAANAPPTHNNNPTSIRALTVGTNNLTSPITPAAIAAAQTFLSPSQIAALVNQQAVQQASAAISASFQGNPIAVPSPGPMQTYSQPAITSSPSSQSMMSIDAGGQEAVLKQRPIVAPVPGAP